MQGLQRARAPFRRLPEADPGHVARHDGARGFVEMPAILVCVVSWRGVQRVEQDVDVAHGETFVLPNERKRVVSCAAHRELAFGERVPVRLHDPAGIHQQNAPAQFATPARRGCTSGASPSRSRRWTKPGVRSTARP